MDKIKYLSTDGTQTIVNKINENQVLKQDSKGNISSRYIDQDGTTTYSTVTGEGNTVIGSNSLTDCTYSFAIGTSNTIKSGHYNCVIGQGNIVTKGYYQNVEGNGNQITIRTDGYTYGINNHVEGYANQVYNTARYSHVEGCRNLLGDDIDISIASDCLDGAHVEGYSNTVTGKCSHTEGYHNTVKGAYSHAEGYYNMTTNESEHACGQYGASTTSSTDSAARTLFSIGNGERSQRKRHNAVEVKLNGDFYVQSKTTTDKSDLLIKDAPMKRLQTWLNEKQDTQKFEDTSDASITLKPNVYYNITITDAVTLTLEKPTDETVSNVYQFCFDVDTSVPKITFPTGIMWEDTTTLLDSSHYEYTIRYVKGTYYGSRKRWAKQL